MIVEGSPRGVVGDLENLIHDGAVFQRHSRGHDVENQGQHRFETNKVSSVEDTPAPTHSVWGDADDLAQEDVEQKAPSTGG